MSESGSSRPPAERKTRRHERKRVEVPVTIVEAEQRTAGGLVFDASDMSLGGVFLRSTVLFEVDEELSIEFTVGPQRVMAMARVVRVSYDDPPGMGIEFTQLGERDREAIKSYLQKA